MHAPQLSKETRFNAGFTLIELLIVITIIGVMAGVISLSITNSSYQRQIRKEAQRFTVIMNMAVDEAIFQGKEIGLQIYEDGYRFVIWEDSSDTGTELGLDKANLNNEENENNTQGAVVKAGDEDPYGNQAGGQNAAEEDGYTGQWVLWQEKGFTEHFYENGINIYFEAEEGELELRNLEDTLEEEAKLQEEMEEEQEQGVEDFEIEEQQETLLPMIFILSSGEVTPFKLELYPEEDSDYIYEIVADVLGKITLNDPGAEEEY